MASTLSPDYSTQRRDSAESERRHLLADSVAPSESASIITDITGGDGDRTPRARSPASSVRHVEADTRSKIPANQQPYPRRDTMADPSSVPAPYRGFPSEAQYLAALNQWAESKKYIETTDTALIGFYGATTMEEYASRPTQDLGIKKKWRARKEAKRAKQEDKSGARRTTVT